MNAKEFPLFTVCVLSYQGKDELRNCLRTILGQQGQFTLELLVTDNGSTDGTAEMVRTAFPQADLTVNARNLPFTTAFNSMVRRARGQWVGVISNDIELEGSSCMQKARDLLESDPKLVMVGPKQVKPDGALDRICKAEADFYELILAWTFLGSLFPRARAAIGRRTTGLNLEISQAVEVLQDSCIFFKRSVIEDNILYDERFRMYYTEDDICVRLRRRGWRILYSTEIVATHRHRHGTRKSNKLWVEWIYLNDAIRYGMKFFGRTRACLVLSPLAYITFVARLGYWAAAGRLKWQAKT